MIFLSPKVVLVKCGERPFLPAEVKEEVKEREEKGKKAKNPETVVAAWPGSPLLVTANSKYHVPKNEAWDWLDYITSFSI